ncbi:hypothetical protein ACCT04_35910, partial [Rhizobium ruizarguesonis]
RDQFGIFGLADQARADMRAVAQHLTVAANLFLGDEVNRFGLMRKKQMEKMAQAVLDDLGFGLPAGALLSSLTICQQQLVATASA